MIREPGIVNNAEGIRRGPF